MKLLMNEYVMKPSVFDQKSTVVMNTQVAVNFDKFVELKKYEDKGVIETWA